MKRRARQFGVLVQALLGLGLLYWLIARMDNQSDMLAALGQACEAPGWLFSAFAAVFLCIVVCTVRWWILLRFLGFKLPFRTALRYYFIGQFFNAFMLGSTGGDIVKATAIAVRSPGRRTEAATSVAVDRFIGLVALALLALVVALVHWQPLWGTPATRAIVLLAVATASCGAAILLGSGRADFTRLVSWLSQRLPGTKSGDLMRRAAATLHRIAHHPGILSLAFILSLINHLVMALCAWSLGHALGIAPAAARLAGVYGRSLGDVGVYVTLAPLITLVATVPVTLAGLGTREAATVAVLGLAVYAVPDSQAISLGLLIFAIGTIWSALSGIIYFATRLRQTAASDKALADGDHARP